MYYSMFLGPRVFTPNADRAVIDASIEQALEADEAGFTAIYVGEQHHNNYEPYSDPFTMGGWLGAQLTQAWIGTSVIPLVLHHPLALIERMNLLDLLMRGRVMYGISSGVPLNGTAFGIGEMSSEYRARLFDQRLELLLEAWAHRPEDGPLEFKTDAEHGVLDGRVMPYSYRVPHPLFAIGTGTSAKVRQAGSRGFYVQLGPVNFEGTVRLAQTFREALEESAHNPDEIAERLRWFSSTKWIIVGETDDQAWELAQQQFGGAVHFLPWLVQEERFAGKTLRELHFAEDPGPFAAGFGGPESAAAWTQRCHIIGSPETVAYELRRYADAGLPHLHARWLNTNISIEAGRRSFRLFVDEVMPRLGVDRMPAPAAAAIRPEFSDAAPVA